jgi:hypothetical protein
MSIPKRYKKPNITMNRKKYGTKVKPVKQKKPESRLERPSTAELRSIYSQMKKSATWQIPDSLAEAVQWYRRMTAYLYANANNHNPKLLEAMLKKWKSLNQISYRREKMMETAKAAHTPLDKTLALTSVIRYFEEEVGKFGFKVPLLKDSIKKAKMSAKKLDVRKEQVEKKFDPVLTMLSAASDLDVDLGAIPAFADGRSFNYESTLNRMIYSRSALDKIKKRIRAEGFLPVVLEQIAFIARAAAMKKSAKKDGTYLVDNQDWLHYIALGQRNLCKWLATSQDAPSKLVKRTVPKKKRVKKVRPPSEPDVDVTADAIGGDIPDADDMSQPSDQIIL